MTGTEAMTGDGRRHGPAAGRFLRNATLGSVLAFGAVGWAQLLHQADGHAHDHGPSVPPVVHLVRDAGLAVPLVIAVVWVAQVLLARRVGQRSATAEVAAVAAATTAALVAAAPLHGLLFEAAGEPLVEHLVRTGVTIAPATVVLAAAFAAWWPASRRPWTPAVRFQPAFVLGLTAALAASVVVVDPPAPAAATGDGVCPAGARTIRYDVAAFQTVIPLNGWGDHVPNGLMYALRGADARVGKDHILANPNLTQPLVIRANVGDCIKVSLRNDISQGRYQRVGLHADPIVQFDPKTSDGANIGNNPDTTAATGQTVEYTWYADREGQGALTDPANLDLGLLNTSSMSFGLYGAIVVHPRGSIWRNPTTGADLLANGRAVETQIFADIHVPADPAASHRAFAVLVGDEIEDVRDRSGHAPTFPTTGLSDSTFGINYRSEPLRNRLRAVLEHRGERRFDPEAQNFVEGGAETITLPSGRVITPADHFCDGYVSELGGVVDDPGAKCIGEEMQLQSWIFGDEGKLTHLAPDGTVVADSDNLIPKAYVGDPVRFHIVHPGTSETHPWHQHTHRWNQDPGNPDSPLKDVQAVAPAGSFEARLQGGAGGRQATVGDSIFHCHLYPHFAQGFWGHLRVFDTLRDGLPFTSGGQLAPLPDGNPGNQYADGTLIEPLEPLLGRPTPVAPSPSKPGFPLFVKGEFGQRAYRPPHAVVADAFATKASANGLPYRRPGDTVRALDGASLEASGLVALAATGQPGAGVIDPCPSDAPVRTYRPHAMDIPLQYNSAGWGTPEGRVYVEEAHVAAVKSGKRKPEPYTIRARLGECVQLLTTNDFHLDDDPNVPIDLLGKYDGVYQEVNATSEVSNHVHLVHFDQLASDGTSVGWNYVQAAMPGQTYAYRWFADVALRTVFFHDHQYANLHQQRGLFAALNIEPADATWHDPTTGAETDGVGTQADIRTPSGADFREFTVFHEDRVPLWRDFDAANPRQHFTQPVIPPSAPDDFGEDQGGQGFNYRNEPFQIRVSPNASNTQKREPAYVYSSAVHGDPATPLFRSYSGDPAVIRNVPGSHEEMHTFNLHGHRWLNQPDNPLSTPIDNQSVSLAEWFNYEVTGGEVRLVQRNRQQTLEQAGNDTINGTPMILTAGAGGSGGAGLPGDYLYASTALDDQWQGLWGLFRVYAGKASDLVPLPDRPAPSTKTSQWPALRPGDALKPVSRKSGVEVCASDDPIRSYQVVAMQLPVTYNATTGDHDPYGLIYALAADESALRAGTKEPEPLVLRANAGECLQISLVNKLTAPLPVHSGDVPLEPGAPWPRPSAPRVSLHPGMVDLDPTRSDGTTVGYNFDQTIAPGGSIVYTWWVPSVLEGATANLVDFGDRVAHRHHGLFAALLVEPKGSTWHHPETGAAIITGDRAVIRWTDAAGKSHARREFVVNVQDGLRLVDGNGAVIQPAADVDDPYDQGARGINYRTERFAPRLLAGASVADVFSSRVHGDPATPVFEAFVGDPFWLRVLQGGDRGRAHSLTLHGHEWRTQRLDPTSSMTSVQDGVMPGRAFTLEFGPTGGATSPVGGAGGRSRSSGDYLFRDGNLRNQVNQGLWGLLRVHQPGASSTRILPL